jgi:DNA polymerase III epsilon subunit-like protein
MKCVVFDTETTGIPVKPKDYTDLAAYENARLVEISWVVFDQHLNVGERYTTLVVGVNGELPVFPESYPFPTSTPQEFTDRGQAVDQVLTKFTDLLTPDTILIGHNLDFDIGMIKSELYRLGRSGGSEIDKITDCARMCTMKIATPPGGRWPKLTNLYGQFFAAPIVAHRADADTETTLMCWLALLYKGQLPGGCCEVFDMPWMECGAW